MKQQQEMTAKCTTGKFVLRECNGQFKLTFILFEMEDDARVLLSRQTMLEQLQLALRQGQNCLSVDDVQIHTTTATSRTAKTWAEVEKLAQEYNAAHEADI